MGDVQWQGVLDMMPQSDLDWIIGSTIVAVITAVIGPVVVLWVTSRLRRDVKATKQQVTNQHATNLRDEVTQGFADLNRKMDHIAPVTGAIRTIQAAQDETRQDIGGLREELRIDRKRVDSQMDALAARVHDLEHPPV